MQGIAGMDVLVSTLEQLKLCTLSDGYSNTPYGVHFNYIWNKREALSFYGCSLALNIQAT
jgi:hypothetical protein